MKYPYVVNHNGVWYPAGSEVPEDTASAVGSIVDTPDEPTEPVNDAVEEILDEEPKAAENVAEAPTRTEINRMPKADLMKLARKCGMKFDDEFITGAELKRMLIEYYEA